MRRREFLRSIALTGCSLSMLQLDALASAVGYHEDGAYNGPLLTRFINTTCGACPGGCGLRVRTVDNIPVRIDGNPIHPVSRGGLCPVGISSLSFLVHPDRIKQPLLRKGPRGSNEYDPITWEEAEGLLIAELTELKSAGNPEQLLFIDSREQGPGLELARNFTQGFGSPNFYNEYNSNSDVAARIWAGRNIGFAYDLENARNFFCFGAPVFESGKNPIYYSALRSKLLGQAEGEKGNFLIIDPRLSASAAKADRWIPIKPNTYGILALGMLNLIIKEQLYDEEAAGSLCEGFEDEIDTRGRRIEGFKSRVLRIYVPSFVAERTGVPVDQIITLARLFASSPGAIAMAGDVAMQTIDGVHQIWAIMALNAVTGKINKPGGVINYNMNPFGSPATNGLKAKPIVSSSSGQFPFQSGLGDIESLPDSILSGSPYPIKVAIFNNVNPVYDSASSGNFSRMFQNIPFSVVISSLHNESTAMADLILPDCTFLEKDDLILPDSEFSHQVIGLRQPVTAPLYQSRQSDDVILMLCRKLLSGEWSARKSYRSYMEEKLGQIYQTNIGSPFSDEFRISFDSLLAERGWRRREYTDSKGFLGEVRKTGGWWNPSQLRERQRGRFSSSINNFYLDSPLLRDTFKSSESKLGSLLTLSGFKIDETSEFSLGPYREIEENERSQFPLDLYITELTTTRGEGGRLNDMADMIGYYEYLKWKSWVELNPETASELGLKDGQTVWVESPTGKIQLLLVLNPGLMPEVAAIPAGLGKKGSYAFGENISRILSTDREIFTGTPAIAETRVKIYA
jgi:anaerobic selenocysteine-containing dehydrogenase